MSETLIKKFKWFWAWQDDKEEQWLGEMARQGLHLNRPGIFGQYSFTQGKPQEVVYRLDFITSARKKEDYYQLFKDSGWEHVGELGGWQYWRKAMQEGVTPEIFTDADSKIQKYRRLLGFLIILMPIYVISLLNAYNHSTRYQDGFFIQVLNMIYFVLFLVFLMVAFTMVMLLRRISSLKRK
jgi:hypothetical protein